MALEYFKDIIPAKSSKNVKKLFWGKTIYVHFTPIYELLAPNIIINHSTEPFTTISGETYSKIKTKPNFASRVD